MGLKILKHYPAEWHLGVYTDKVRGLEGCKKDESKKVECCQRGLFQVSETLANNYELLWNRCGMV